MFDNQRMPCDLHTDVLLRTHSYAISRKSPQQEMGPAFSSREEHEGPRTIVLPMTDVPSPHTTSTLLTQATPANTHLCNETLPLEFLCSLSLASFVHHALYGERGKLNYPAFS